MMSLKEKLLAGEKIYGTMVRVVRNPALCLIAKNSGLDFVMYDCEHASYNMETLHDLFIMGNAVGLEGFLRVPTLSKDYISRALDQGAGGVMVPMLETPEMATDLVKYSKYQPLGDRGYATTIAHVGYKGGGKHTEVMEQANNKVISIAQIETKLSVDNAEAIAATPGIDALLIGPNDLSLSLGIPGDMMNQIEIDAIAHVVAACKKNKKAFGLHGPAKLQEKFIDDINIVMFQTDTEVLASGFVKLKETCVNFSAK
jgi:2-keto-3-deoxy-L-rhamnonate aldolase RhmA